MDTVTEFSRLLGPLRRAVMKKAREAAALPDLPEAQIELLRVPAERGAMSPSEAAARLRIAPSTISNLVRAMQVADLIERIPSPADLRTVTLVPSASARDLLNRYDRTSAIAIKKAADHLDADQQLQFERAIPVLRALLTALELPEVLGILPTDTPDNSPDN
ncbi:MarR family winged helix-turn-helix transcriptional regulator [Glaciimonas immobilis]|uniref:DNA-binding MarR family transcriptional regulator n=1 Tax=Glaciimonas immobilis TaxID=728004 RepID=A0A840RRN2_9BURK|nr:MarR family winged helix-turn-helix transcriptional regulator [Glaciimonas immobilis]KAF3996825.1 winged helix-turn-helix transcriptional regulator [Glaciimonas immobilis]MBB5199626.1 DNA-binding MarR family transcriptional regulator [Glaciimonas immobilis]